MHQKSRRLVVFLIWACPSVSKAQTFTPPPPSVSRMAHCIPCSSPPIYAARRLLIRPTSGGLTSYQWKETTGADPALLSAAVSPSIPPSWNCGRSALVRRRFNVAVQSTSSPDADHLLSTDTVPSLSSARPSRVSLYFVKFGIIFGIFSIVSLRIGSRSSNTDSSPSFPPAAAHTRAVKPLQRRNTLPIPTRKTDNATNEPGHREYRD